MSVGAAKKMARLCLPLLLWAAAAQAGHTGRLLDRARRATDRGTYQTAMEFYLQAAGEYGGATADQQEAILRGLLDTAQSLLEQNQPEPAIQGLEVLLPLTRKGRLPKSFSMRANMALEYAATAMVLGGRPDLAARALEALLRGSPGTPMRWALLARSYLEAGDLELAGRTLHKAAALHPDSPELMFVRADLAGSLARLEVGRSGYQRAEFLMQDALGDLEEAARREPRTGGIHRALGRMRSALFVYYRATGQYHRALQMLEAAESAYTSAAYLEAHNPEPAFELGRLLQTSHDWVFSEPWLREAGWRYRRLAEDRSLPEAAREAARRDEHRCRQAISSNLVNRAIDAANTARFDHARELLLAAAQELPSRAKGIGELLDFVQGRRRVFQSQLDRSRSGAGSAENQVALGDLRMGARRYDLARQAYQRALEGDLGQLLPQQVQDRLFGALPLVAEYLKSELQVGSLQVQLESPVGLDRAFMHNLLQRAHALTMAVFPHRLNGPVGIKVFSNRRAFLEQAALRVGLHQQGFYALGRVVTFYEPGRTQESWLKMLVHEISHRYVDELTYSNAPRWLDEGLALWISEGWSPDRRVRLERLAGEGGLTPWGEMERLFEIYWNDPRKMDVLGLQSQQMVQWLVERFSLERLLILLAALREGQPQDSAMLSAYGLPAEILEVHWAREMR